MGFFDMIKNIGKKTEAVVNNAVELTDLQKVNSELKKIEKNRNELREQKKELVGLVEVTKKDIEQVDILLSNIESSKQKLNVKEKEDKTKLKEIFVLHQRETKRKEILVEARDGYQKMLDKVSGLLLKTESDLTNLYNTKEELLMKDKITKTATKIVNNFSDLEGASGIDEAIRNINVKYAGTEVTIDEVLQPKANDILEEINQDEEFQKFINS